MSSFWVPLGLVCTLNDTFKNFSPTLEGKSSDGLLMAVLDCGECYRLFPRHGVVCRDLVEV